MTTVAIGLDEFRELTRKCAILESAKRYIESCITFEYKELSALKAIMEIEEDLDVDIDVDSVEIQYCNDAK